MNKRAMTIEDMSNLERVSDVQFHPDGNDYVYIKTSINDADSYNSHLYASSVVEREHRQWTFGDVLDHTPRFSPDGKQLVFLSNRSGTNQLWMIPTTGGEPQQLTFLKYGAGTPLWSPDGKTLLFSAHVLPDTHVYNEGELSPEAKKEERERKQKEPLRITRLKHKSDSRGWHDETVSQLLLYTIDTREVTRLTEGSQDALAPAWHPDGTKVSFAMNKHGDGEQLSDIFIMNLADKSLEQATSGDGLFSLPGWSPDGSLFSYAGHQKGFAGSTQTEIYIKTSQGTNVITKAYDMQFPDSMISDWNSSAGNPGYVWKDNQNVITTASRYGKTGLFSLSVDGELTVLYEENAHVFEYSYHRKSDTFIVGISQPTDPSNLFLLETGDKAHPLTQLNATILDEVELAQPITHSFTADDGWTIEGWLLKPFGFQEDHSYPLILEVHGGPHAMYGYAFFHELQVLAGKGYAVLYTNPRGSYGYGQTFVDAVRGDYGGNDYTDLLSAVDQTVDAYGWIDADNIGVTGGSYGGFMTNWIVSHTNRFKAAVTQRSISNWLSFYGVSDIGYFFTKWEIGAHLLEDPEKLWNHSPLKYAKNVETPLLILHGEQDLRCPIEQGEQWFQTLKHLGKETEFVRFPNANHELSRSGPPALRKKRLKEIVNWFESYIPVQSKVIEHG
ncbi:LOW QUALITY PROTEIN: acylamino-acid-releasing enzyme [Geomicrobium sp. JCM 19039]|nr:LOW QUALITY PROTEIN: acylamino-acid-releasing enzyme [Geomicrobium sp. JCM 19039]